VRDERGKLPAEKLFRIAMVTVMMFEKIVEAKGLDVAAVPHAGVRKLFAVKSSSQ